MLRLLIFKNWFRRYFEFKSHVIKQIPVGLFCLTRTSCCPYYKTISHDKGECKLLKKQILHLCKVCDNNTLMHLEQEPQIEKKHIKLSWKKIILEICAIIVCIVLAISLMLLYCWYDYNNYINK